MGVKKGSMYHMNFMHGSPLSKIMPSIMFWIPPLYNNHIVVHLEWILVYLSSYSLLDYLGVGKQVPDMNRAINVWG